MQTTQFRNGVEVRKDYVDFFDFRQIGGFMSRSTATGFTVKKGDTFLVECWYVCVFLFMLIACISVCAHVYTCHTCKCTNTLHSYIHTHLHVTPAFP